MAVKTATFETIGGGCRVITWGGLANGDTGTPVQMPSHPDKTVQLVGTLSVGGTMTLQGSNDNTNWFTLSDSAGSDIALTALDGVTVMENPLYIRPNITAGDGSTDLTVILVALDK
jgi:hypothetical protein